MSYLIRESNKKDSVLIEEFNKDLENKGFPFKLPKSNSEVGQIKDIISERKFVLIENEVKVRAGYTLKSQWFKINNSSSKIGYYYNPVTAGLINKKYNFCGVMLLNNALKESPDLFCLGMGDLSQPLPKLLNAFNWKLEKVPFFFKVYRPINFLKNIEYLKKNKIKKIFIKFITFTGTGWLLIKLIFLFNSLLNFKLIKYQSIKEEEIEEFSEDINSVWENTKENNSFCAIRNKEYLTKLYSDKKFIKLQFFYNNKIIGWSVSLCNKLNKHKQFGNMKLGSIVDCLSIKGYEKNIINKTLKKLKEKEADLVVSNQSHKYWKNALKYNNFLSGPSNYIFASSIELTKKLKLESDNKDFFHITRADGDGPINL